LSQTEEKNNNDLSKEELWDEIVFHRPLAGPSKFIVVPLSSLIFKAAKKAPLHNRFRYDETDAIQEIKELIDLRNLNRCITATHLPGN
jgi:hypothetical protein